MTQGSVIEVATWRGVGRPDSRTSRLMLGMGSGNVNEESDADGSQGSASQSQQSSGVSNAKGFAGFKARALHFLKNFNRINWAETLKALIASLTSKKGKKKRGKNKIATGVEVSPVSDSGAHPSVTVSLASEDADIEAWLNKITEKASRESSPKKSANSTSVKAASKPKAKAPVKKATQKSSTTRASKKR